MQPACFLQRQRCDAPVARHLLLELTHFHGLRRAEHAGDPLVNQVTAALVFRLCSGFRFGCRGGRNDGGNRFSVQFDDGPIRIGSQGEDETSHRLIRSIQTDVRYSVPSIR